MPISSGLHIGLRPTRSWSNITGGSIRVIVPSLFCAVKAVPNFCSSICLYTDQLNLDLATCSSSLLVRSDMLHRNGSLSRRVAVKLVLSGVSWRFGSTEWSRVLRAFLEDCPFASKKMLLIVTEVAFTLALQNVLKSSSNYYLVTSFGFPLCLQSCVLYSLSMSRKDCLTYTNCQWNEIDFDVWETKRLIMGLKVHQAGVKQISLFE